MDKRKSRKSRARKSRARKSRARKSRARKYRLGRPPPPSRTPSPESRFYEDYIQILDEIRRRIELERNEAERRQMRSEVFCHNCRNLVPLLTTRLCRRQDCSRIFCGPCQRNFCDNNCRRLHRLEEQERQREFEIRPRTRAFARSCSICMNDNPDFITECGHQFHRECLRQWRRREHTCPQCRGPI